MKPLAVPKTLTTDTDDARATPLMMIDNLSQTRSLGTPLATIAAMIAPGHCRPLVPVVARSGIGAPHPPAPIVVRL